MPYKTVMKHFSADGYTWMEPERVWVDPTPEEAAAEEAKAADLRAREVSLIAKMDKLIDDMKKVTNR